MIKTLRVLYLVENGEVKEADGDEDPDGMESVFVIAYSASEALELANAYDQERLAACNTHWNGKTIVAVRR